MILALRSNPPTTARVAVCLINMAVLHFINEDESWVVWRKRAIVHDVAIGDAPKAREDFAKFLPAKFVKILWLTARWEECLGTQANPHRDLLDIAKQEARWPIDQAIELAICRKKHRCLGGKPRGNIARHHAVDHQLHPKAGGERLCTYATSI